VTKDKAQVTSSETVIVTTLAKVPFFGDKGLIFTIYNGELNRMRNETFKYSNIETGGQLFGYWHENNPVIVYLTESGPNSSHQGTSFIDDEDSVNGIANYLINNFRLSHLGAWHSHHTLGLRQPSPGDTKTYETAFKDHPTIDRLLACIATLERRGPELEFALNPYIYFREKSNNRSILRQFGTINVLPNDSPYKIDLNEISATPWYEKERGRENIKKIISAFQTFAIQWSLQNGQLNLQWNDNPDEKLEFSPDFLETGMGEYWSSSGIQRVKVFDFLRNVLARNTNFATQQQDASMTISKKEKKTKEKTNSLSNSQNQPLGFDEKGKSNGN